MKTIITAAALTLVATSAFAQVPALPAVGNNPADVPKIVSGVASAGSAAGIVILDINTVRRIPAFNQPGPGGSPGTLSTMSFNIGSLLNSIRPAP